ncbi:hypothetical protein ACS0TY_017865 [Phlomoides rotata]
MVSGFRQDVMDELEVDISNDQVYRARRGRPKRERRHDVDEPSVKSKKSAKGRAPTALKRWQSTKGGSKGAGSKNRLVDESSALGTQEDATISAGSQSRHIRSLSIFRESNTQGYGSRSARSLGAVTKSARSQKFVTRSAGSQPTPTKFLRTKTLTRKKLVHNRPLVAEQNKPAEYQVEDQMRAAEVGGQLISKDQLMSPEQLRSAVEVSSLKLKTATELMPALHQRQEVNRSVEGSPIGLTWINRSSTTSVLS